MTTVRSAVSNRSRMRVAWAQSSALNPTLDWNTTEPSADLTGEDGSREDARILFPELEQ